MNSPRAVASLAEPPSRSQRARPGGESVSAEADRQLSEQRAQADAFATRSGLMTAATALLMGFVASSQNASDLSHPLLWIIGLAAVAGVLVLGMSRLLLGPSASELSRWSIEDQGSALLDAKLLTLEANSRALLRTELVFSLQVFLTVAGIFLIIYGIGGA